MSFTPRQALKQTLYCSIYALATVSGTSHAAGFGIIEQSVTGLGNAFAGGSSGATDASTIYFNPAGMTRLDGAQAIFAVHVIDPNAKFKDQGSTHFTTASLDVNNENGGDAGPVALVPNFYYSRPINQQWTFGVGIGAPFGLVTEYDDGWVGRYHALTSELKTVNINPSLAYKVDDKLSLGFGLNAQYIEARLTNAVDYGGLCFAGENITMTLPAGTCTALNLSPQADDGEAEVKGDDWSFGYNLGMMWQATPQTRIGIAYRSRIKHTLKGDADFDTPNNPATGNATAIAAGRGLVDTDVKAKVTLPDSLSVGFNHEIDSKWTVNGDLTWTNWSEFEELRIEFDSGAADSVTTTKWQDSNRYSLGVSYVPNKQWTWRGGIAFDESANRNSENQTPRVPDQDRTWLTAGFTYKSSDKLSFDVGYAHLFVKDAKINKSLADTENTLRGALVGEYEIDIDILSVQARWAF
ncbi:OmpP1/FadL family transporter [Sulfuriflexus mobilis]|uniref:OmpP1/FadL family transporter n=1 Tax=Sulfuriflexus mobilis TaxID=1811807 RepID=UPI000F8228DA|nr:outer membrane protein transport protein [Sulfuriflexus mobilis]